MSMVFLIYDDCTPVPQDIQDIIGTEYYSKVIKRQQTLLDIVMHAMRQAVPKGEFVHLRNIQDRERLILQIENADQQAFFMRLPSCLMPADVQSFGNMIYKSSFALNNTLLGTMFHDEAVSILDRDSMLTLLRTQDSSIKRELFLRLQDSSNHMVDCAHFVDLRRTEGFLKFMSHATQARYFNSAQIDSGVFRKTSTDKDKMRGEHLFFNLVSDAMRRFLIPTFDFQEDEHTVSYAMEHMAIPDAALQLIHGAFDPDSFAVLLDRYFDYIRSRQGDEVGADHVRAVARKKIWGKLESRLTEFLETPSGQRLNAILREAGPYGDLKATCERGKALVHKAIALDNSDTLLLSHGDPCLSNILFDRRIGLFRLIDPRGGCRREDILMHPLYDLAKFSHSILGSYDFINNGLFDCELNGEMTLSLLLHQGGTPSWMRDMFVNRLNQEGFNPWIVRSYELTLFLSMLPLHLDYPKKLPAFVLTACNIIHKLESTQ